MRSRVPDSGPGLPRQLLAVCLLPVMATIAVPALLIHLYGVNVGWGLGGAAAALPIGFGALASLVGLWLVYETVSLFGRVGEGTLAPWDPTQKLVVEGPYRRVRNPMITGVALVLLGEAAVLGSTAILVELAVFAAANALWMPLVEEPGMVRRFGPEYEEYRSSVPRWIPRRASWTR
jgi:protein-S-isoprenylcysteine O-methyltransferase Ste14